METILVILFRKIQMIYQTNYLYGAMRVNTYFHLQIFVPRRPIFLPEGV